MGEILQNSKLFFPSAAMLTWNKMKYRLIPAVWSYFQVKKFQKTPSWWFLCYWHASASVHGPGQVKMSGEATLHTAECTDSKSKERHVHLVFCNTFFECENGNVKLPNSRAKVMINKVCLHFRKWRLRIWQKNWEELLTVLSWASQSCFLSGFAFAVFVNF